MHEVLKPIGTAKKLRIQFRVKRGKIVCDVTQNFLYVKDLFRRYFSFNLLP